MKKKQPIHIEIDEAEMISQQKKLDNAVDRLLDWMGFSEDDGWDNDTVQKAQEALAKAEQLTSPDDTIDEALDKLEKAKKDGV